MKIVVQARPGELAQRLGEAVEALERQAAGDLHKAAGEGGELLIPELLQAKQAAEPAVERIRAQLEARLLELIG